MITCNVCGVSKDESMFTKLPRVISGRASTCKVCRRTIVNKEDRDFRLWLRSLSKELDAVGMKYSNVHTFTERLKICLSQPRRPTAEALLRQQYIYRHAVTNDIYTLREIAELTGKNINTVIAAFSIAVRNGQDPAAMIGNYFFIREKSSDMQRMWNQQT